jgi:hypothetical protein
MSSAVFLTDKINACEGRVEIGKVISLSRSRL